MSDKFLEDIVENCEAAIERTEKVVKIPVVLFADGFVKRFVEDTDSGVSIAKWIDIAGSPFNKVELVNESGEVVDIVPPIMGYTLESESSDTSNFEASLRKSELQNKQFPRSGDKIVKTAMDKTLGDKVNNAEWTTLITKYYHNEVEIEEKKEAPTSSGMTADY